MRSTSCDPDPRSPTLRRVGEVAVALDVALPAQLLDPGAVLLLDLALPELARERFLRLLEAHRLEHAALDQLEHRTAERQHEHFADPAVLERRERLAHPRCDAREWQPADVAAVARRGFGDLRGHLLERLAARDAIARERNLGARGLLAALRLASVGAQDLPHVHGFARLLVLPVALVVERLDLVVFDLHARAEHSL